jgi:hypothetical protein
LQKTIEGQLKELAGATHEASLKDVAGRVQMNENRIEKHRKRLKYVENIDGGSLIVKEVKQLQYLPHLQLATHATAFASAPPNPTPPQP